MVKLRCFRDSTCSCQCSYAARAAHACPPATQDVCQHGDLALPSLSCSPYGACAPGGHASPRPSSSDLSPPSGPAANPWMTQMPLVVKPDCLFGKRGKHDLVGLKLDYLQAQEFVAARMNKVGGRGPSLAACRRVLQARQTGPKAALLPPQASAALLASGGCTPPPEARAPAAGPLQVVDMDGTVGKINCFIIEPFVPHEDEVRTAAHTQACTCGARPRARAYGMRSDLDSRWLPDCLAHACPGSSCC